MQRLQDKPLEFKGEITAFLSLIFVIMFSFVGTMVEYTSISITKSMKQAELLLAMESIFAEYEPSLLKEYGILAKQGSSSYSIANRLSYYGASNLEHEILRMSLLSDKSGQEFYRQAILCMGGRVTLSTPSILNPYKEKAQQIKEEFQALDLQVPELEAIPTALLLAFVLPKEEVLSNKMISLSELPSHRSLQEGIGTAQEVSKTLVGKGLFSSYLTKHFSYYTVQSHENSLNYEIEYLLAGKSSDKENLEWVARRLLAIRVAVNYGLLLADGEKTARAESLALGISTALAIPEAMEVIKQAFLFFWAYEDSIADLKRLFLGEQVPLGRNEEGKLADYEDYLRALLASADTEKLCMRALDLLELNLGIQVDECVTALEIESTGYTRKNIRYRCKAAFAYE